MRNGNGQHAKRDNTTKSRVGHGTIRWPVCKRLDEIGHDKELPVVSTPFIDEGDKGNVARRPASNGSGATCPWCKGIFPSGGLEAPQRVTRKRGGHLASALLTNTGPEMTDDPGGGCFVTAVPGKLAASAAKIIMKVFWAARVARLDILRAVGFPACHIPEWDMECDRRLHRLMSYLNCTRDYRLVGCVGSPAVEASLHLYSDADFAGCQKMNKPTSGVFMSIEGPSTFFPVSASSKKQTSVSHST